MRPKRPDDDELRRFYREHVDAVFAFFAYSVGRDVAEDLTASTFERALRSWKRYDPAIAGRRTWVLSIARNLLVDHYRRQKHRRAVSLDDDTASHDQPSHDDEIGRRLDQAELRQWLSSLNERERHVLALRFGADLEAAEVAVILGLTTANVHQIASRAMRHLRAVATASRVRDQA